MGTKQPDTKIQVRFPHDVWSEVKRLAIKHERSFNGEVIWALRVYIGEQNEELVTCLVPRDESKLQQ